MLTITGSSGKIVFVAEGTGTKQKELQTGAWLPLGYKGNVSFREP